MKIASGFLVAAALAVAGCGGPVTSVDLIVTGADKLGGDQLSVSGSVGGEAYGLPETEPAVPRALAATETLRIVVGDDLDKMRLVLRVEVLKAGVTIADQSSSGLIVLHRTKEVEVDFVAQDLVDLGAAPDLSPGP